MTADCREQYQTNSREEQESDVGTDLGSVVDFTYELPFTFTGKVEKVTIELK